MVKEWEQPEYKTQADGHVVTIVGSGETLLEWISRTAEELGVPTEQWDGGKGGLYGILCDLFNYVEKLKG